MNWILYFILCTKLNNHRSKKIGIAVLKLLDVTNIYGQQRKTQGKSDNINIKAFITKSTVIKGILCYGTIFCIPNEWLVFIICKGV